MYHYFNAITNLKGDALVGYYVRATDPDTLDVVDIYADDSSTPIISDSEVANMAKVDSNGNVSFWVEAGDYHLDIYATDATTFVLRVPNIPMQFGLQGEQGVQGEAGDVAKAADRDAVADIVATAGMSRFLIESGREGLFVFDDSDLSTEVAADSQRAIYIPLATDTTGASGAWVRKFSGGHNVKWFGATGDGSTDDRAAIQAAVDLVNTLGGGTVLLPKGTYIVGKGAGAYSIQLSSNVTLQGEGRGSVIKRSTGTDAARTINIAGGVSNVAIRDLAVDGDRDNHTSSGHGMAAYGVTDLLIQNVLIKQCYSYGFGVQDGTNTGIRLDNVAIEDVGSDGIDIKNVNDDNADFHFSNVSVVRWGLNTSEATQAALDCRGTILGTNIFIAEPGDNDSVGLRFRQGELTDTNGLGAHQCAFSNVDIRMDTDATVNGSGNVQFGIYSAARNVRINGGTVNGGLRGVQIIESSNRVSLRVNAAVGDGILIAQNAADPGLTPHKTILEGCRATNCAGDGIQIEANDCELIACQAESNTGYGLNITATSSRTRVIGGVYGSNNTAGRINDGGATTTIRYVEGVADKVSGNAQSGTYTPTLTNQTNIDSTTPGVCFWTRAGDVVTVSGGIVIDPTASGAETRVRLTLPVSTTFADSGQAGGTAAATSGAQQTFGINAVAATALAQITGFSATASSLTHHFTFSYRVV